MPANVALTGSEITNLNNPNHLVPYRFSYCPDAVRATATVSATPTTTPIVQISVSSPSANWTSGKIGETVKVTSPGGVLRGYFRLRYAAPTSNLIYIGEVTNADAGLITKAQRTAGITSGDIVTILERRDIWSVKPRTDEDGTINQDYAVTVGTKHASPLPICNMTINGRGEDYCTYITTATKAMTATVSVTRNIGSLTYSWAVPSAWTGVAGTNTATVTGNAPPGAYWLYCTITDATAGAQEICRFVRIHDTNDAPIDIVIVEGSDVRDRQTRRMSVRFPQGTISTLPASPRCVVWSDATWGGQDVSTATRSFTGYLITQPFSHVPAYHESIAEIVGVCGVLDMIGGYPITFTYTGTTSTWENLGASYSNAQFVQEWICRYRCANVMETHGFTPFTTSSTIARRKHWAIDPASLYQQLKQVGDMYEVNVGSRSSGEVICRIHPSMMADRSGVATRATLTNSIYKNVNVLWSRRPGVGFVRYEGYYSNLAADIKVHAQAPGKEAKGQGAGGQPMQNKIFENVSDAKAKAGRRYAMLNNEYGSGTFDIPMNWDVFEPADMQFVTVQIPAGRSPTGSAFEIDTIPETVTKNWHAGTRAGISLKVEGETDWLEGEEDPIPAEQPEIFGPYSSEEMPEILSAGWGPETDIVPFNSNGTGNALLFTSDGFVARYDGVTFTDISPAATERASLGTGIKMIADPWNYAGLILYGSNGAVVTDDHTAGSVSWRYVPLTAQLSPSTTTTSYSPNSTAYNGGNGNNSGVTVAVGDSVTITTTGTWDVATGTGGEYIVDANGKSGTTPATGFYLESANIGALLYRIGTSGAWTLAGTGATFTAATAGTLYLIANENGAAGHGDNSGSLNSSIAVTRTTPSGEEFILDIAGSINQEGYICWLAKRTVSAVDYVYLNYSNDRFRTIRSTQVARYVSTIKYTIALNSYSASGALQVRVTAGDPGNSDNKVYESNDSGETFAALTGTTILAGGGNLMIPYQKGDQTANGGATPQYGYVIGTSGGTLLWRNYTGATVTIAVTSATPPAGGYVVNGYTLDADILAIPLSDNTFYRSTDGAATNWVAGSAVPGSGVLGMTGWVTNPDFYVAYGTATLAYTTDGGTVGGSGWTNIRSDWNTFIAANYSGGGGTVVTMFGDLARFYATEVVT